MEKKSLVTLDDSDVLPDFGTVYKGTKDSVVRVYFPEPNKIFVYDQHFVENVGFMRCLADKGLECPICARVSQPTRKFKTNFIVYSTGTTDGTLVDADNRLDFVTMRPYIYKFGSKGFAVLQAKNKKFKQDGGKGLVMMDLTMKCTNDQYQHFDVDDIGPTIHAANDRLKAMFDACVKKFVDFEKDRDARFGTEKELNDFLVKALGASVSTSPTNLGGKDLLSSKPQTQAVDMSTRHDTDAIPEVNEENANIGQKNVQDLLPENTAKVLAPEKGKNILNDV